MSDLAEHANKIGQWADENKTNETKQKGDRDSERKDRDSSEEVENLDKYYNFHDLLSCFSLV